MVSKIQEGPEVEIEFDRDENGLVDRALQKHGKYSRQPRFDASQTPEQFFMSTLNWTESEELRERKYSVNSRMRDKWLREFVKLEPFLYGVLTSVVDIDKNRGWKIVGGRNQVKKYTSMLHTFQAAPGLTGYRPALSVASKSFWNSDIGAIIELGRDGAGGPVTELYNVDSANCVLTGDDEKPLEYHPTTGKDRTKQVWSYEDFIRVSSMPSEDEKFNGLGYCAVSRCIELAKLMIAVYQHDHEQLGSRAPRGLLLLQGITEKQWKNAMEARSADADALGYQYFGALAVLASSMAKIDAKMLALSQLPVSFNLREWVDMLLYGYALCWGFDAAEFIPVQFGALGRGTEQEIQHEKATGKGRLDFVLGFQEQLQEVLPDSVDFSYTQRDEKGDLIHAQVNQAWSTVVKTLYESGASVGQPLLSWEESRILLADYGVISRNWSQSSTVSETDVSNEDVEEEDTTPTNGNSTENVPSPEAVVPTKQTRRLLKLREEMRNNVRVRNAAYKFPDQPIVEYVWPGNFEFVLWERGDEILKPSLWTVG